MAKSVSHRSDSARRTAYDVDAEIARTRAVMAQINDLDNELAKIAHIGDIVKSFRRRIETLDHKMNQSSRRRH